MIHKINFNFDKNLLLDEFTKTAGDHTMIGGYDFLNHDLSLVRERFASQVVSKLRFTGEYCVNYMFYAKGTTVEEHTDDPWIGSTCLNNIINDNTDPVYFGDHAETYDTAILDVSKPHSLRDLSSDRIVCRISFRNIDYENLLEKANKWLT